MPPGHWGRPQFKPLTSLGPYQIEGLLGQGAAAAVYRARRQDGTYVALKVLHQQASIDLKLREAFQHEARILLKLRHPGILRAYETGQMEGHFYISLALIEGETLDQFLTQNKKSGETAAIDIGIQTANALTYMHEKQIVHRDIKPANILLQNRRRPVIFDFGAAIDLNADKPVPGEIFGTPAFLSPEQARGDATIDGRADLYGLGVTLYRAVSGRKPFYGSRAEVLHAQIHTPPPPPSEFGYVSKELEAVILRTLAKVPADRYQTGAELAQALEDARLRAPEQPPELPQRLLHWLRGTITPGE